jgi:hypothetical protein
VGTSEIFNNRPWKMAWCEKILLTSPKIKSKGQNFVKSRTPQGNYNYALLIP